MCTTVPRYILMRKYTLKYNEIHMKYMYFIDRAKYSQIHRKYTANTTKYIAEYAYLLFNLSVGRASRTWRNCLMYATHPT